MKKNAKLFGIHSLYYGCYNFRAVRERVNPPQFSAVEAPIKVENNYFKAGLFSPECSNEAML